MAIQIRPLDPALVQPAFRLATRVFIEASTLHRALGIDLEAYRAYLRRPFEAMVAEGLSVVATDGDGGDVAGCLIGTDFHRQLHRETGPEAEFAPLAALTGRLCEAYRKQRSVGPGEVVLVDMGAVAGAAAGRGVYRRMRKAVHHMARERGFRRVVGELSSDATQHVVLDRLGHRKLAEVRFDAFEFGGEYPFLSIGSPASIILAEGDL